MRRRRRILPLNGRADPSPRKRLYPAAFDLSKYALFSKIRRLIYRAAPEAIKNENFYC
jgi:hypothetical protein